MADADHWLASLPIIGERPLRDDEVEPLARLRFAIARESALAVLTMVALLILWISYFRAEGIYVWLIPLIMIAVGPLWRWGRLPRARLFWLKTHRGVRRDQLERRVLICGEAGVTLEVLAQSHLIWSRNGVRSSRPVVARASSTATVPVHAAMAANFVRPVEWSDTLLAHRRPMTPGEVRELEAYAPRPAIPIMVITVLCAIGAIATVARAIYSTSDEFLTAFAFSLFTFYSARSWLRAYRPRKRFRNDIEAEWLLIIRDVDPTGEGAHTSEYLPFSKVLWTEDGRPSRWRKAVAGASFTPHQ